ncbi:hypothetical protein FA95DRAFT_1578590 [Auriscalpium vulgare]|uniref:Uncharacterized protein n=1 Tax=Auriscalpium vulgare TaxID=40419 RepID=A0ACB8R134_9AGAM|nr:hypothetical protein FA95DRAFT_1578590 [Auriscalpium vulgare]
MSLSMPMDQPDILTIPPSMPMDSESVLQRAVVRAAELHEEKSYGSGIYTRVFHLGDYDDSDASYHHLSVKYNDQGTTKAEMAALKFLYALACKDGDAAPLVPQVVHSFYCPHGLGYIVMKRIELRTVPDHELYAKAAEAVLWLRAQRPPPMEVFGSLGASYARHAVFKYFEAPLKFTGVAAVQRYFNTVVNRVRILRRGTLKIADVFFEGEEIVLTQSDMAPSNFGVSSDGRAVIFDAATIQALPVTLADFTLLRTTPFATAVSKHVFGDERAMRLASPNLASLAEVRRLLFMAADATFGVDEDGNTGPTVGIVPESPSAVTHLVTVCEPARSGPRKASSQTAKL